jgi:hypothetical protein
LLAVMIAVAFATLLESLLMLLLSPLWFGRTTECRRSEEVLELATIVRSHI